MEGIKEMLRLRKSKRPLAKMIEAKIRRYVFFAFPHPLYPPHHLYFHFLTIYISLVLTKSKSRHNRSNRLLHSPNPPLHALLSPSNLGYPSHIASCLFNPGFQNLLRHNFYFSSSRPYTCGLSTIHTNHLFCFGKQNSSRSRDFYRMFIQLRGCTTFFPFFANPDFIPIKLR